MVPGGFHAIAGRAHVPAVEGQAGGKQKGPQGVERVLDVCKGENQFKFTGMKSSQIKSRRTSFAHPSTRGCPAAPVFGLTLGGAIYMLRALYNRAVVAADHRRRDGLTLSPRVCEPDASGVVCGAHCKIV